MIKAPFPINEKLRINDLEYYEILDSERENNFDELGELACLVCNCPTALITFVDKDRQWFKAGINIDVRETSREVSFCSHTILQDEVLVVPNAKNDIRFFDNPLVTGDLKINFLQALL